MAAAQRGQVQLLRRAVELTRPGGSVVYSTCSLNPIENEAVVAAVLEAVRAQRSIALHLVPQAALFLSWTGEALCSAEENLKKTNTLAASSRPAARSSFASRTWPRASARAQASRAGASQT